MNVQPFNPVMPAFTQNIAVTATSGQITFAAGQGLEAQTVRILNTGSNLAFVRWGVGTQTAVATTDMPIAAGATEVFTKGLADHLAAICTSGQTTTLYVTPGEGQ